MNSNKIIFKAAKHWLLKDGISTPKPILKSIPDWYRKADRYVKQNKEFIIGTDGGKMPTWKACPAVFDIMATGYSLNTPCDIEFFEKDEKINVKVHDEKYDFFVQKRDEMTQFFHPEGYYKNHFAFFGEWQVILPSGYSAIYTTPFNRYDLPFLTTSGIIDNDKVHLPGSFPFFIRNGFSGVIPAGTPYAQIIPFKRENWISEILEEKNKSKLLKDYIENTQKYRKPNGGIYKNEVWEPRSYE